MSKLVLAFYINNWQEDYYKCMNCIDSVLGNRDSERDGDFTKGVKYYIGESDVESLINEQDVFKDISEYEESVEWEADDVNLILYVHAVDESDMVDFIYFCLLREVYGDRCRMCIKVESQEKKRTANLADFFKNINSNESRAVYIWSSISKKYILLKPDYRIIRHYSPIFVIDRKKESCAYWQKSVDEFLNELYEQYSKDHGMGYGKNYFLPQLFPKGFPKSANQHEMDLNNIGDSVHLMRTFVTCFCNWSDWNESDKKKIIKNRVIKDRYQLWISQSFFEMVKDMPLLAMYIFCILDYFAGDYDSKNIDKIENEIFNARDMADGLLQILENIYHSEYARGYFCFRIHNNTEDRSQLYLQQHYGNYMEQFKNSVDNFLEFKIVDYSRHTIPMQFLRNFDKRMANASENDKKKYQEIRDKAQKLEVRDFFEKSYFWERYNSISENAVNHYGLQIFASLVSCYDGCFRVRSQAGQSLDITKEMYSSIKVDKNECMDGIPGTQYDILLPFKEQKTLQNISVNVNINYTDYLSHEFQLVEEFEAIDTILQDVSRDNNDIYQDWKEAAIHRLKEQIEKLVLKETAKLKLTGDLQKELILHFSAHDIALAKIEIFCKAVMLYIAEQDSAYIMITDCSSSHFVEITRMFALFYDKQGNNSFIRKTQIFLSGEKEGEEFLISGADLSEVIGRTEKLAFARCVHPECFTILKKMLTNRIRRQEGRPQKGVEPNETVNIVPFDMIVYEGSEDTLFEKSLKSVLNKEVESKEFGCKIKDLHVKIGTKIHINAFYEAELLFHNNYYTTRFAYWLFNQIRTNEDIQKSEPITLVGYENYSEMLLNELQKMLRHAKYRSEYIVYEQKSIEKFRTGKAIELYRDTQFIFIVPINSTTSTHVKLSGFLKKSIRNALKEKNENPDDASRLFKKAINYGIILVGSETKNPYWEQLDKHIIKSKINGEIITFYMRVDIEWFNPLECKYCFPRDSGMNERPLIETNRESVVPMQAIGLRKECSEVVPHIEVPENENRIEELSNLLIYKHIKRNGNHYSYYFATEKLWEYPEMRQHIQKWLKECRSKINNDDRSKKVYDIIVAPLHLSNAAFVEEVNHNLFGNAALVLHFDVNKEYRTNVRAKYINIQQLYDNLSASEEESIINFHYVDDTIISGETFYRTKSLVKSLITECDMNIVKVHIFKSIVLLISRLSNASVKNYIEHPSFFMSYFQLNISSMRVKEDACVLCKKHDEWCQIAKKSSLNTTCNYWHDKSRPIQCVPVEELWKVEKTIDDVHKRRATQYMIASHKAKSLLEGMYGSHTNQQIKDQIINILFPQPQDLNIEKLVAVLKVIARPFLSFRKECREIAFELMLTMLDRLLADSLKQDTGSEKLNAILAEVWNDLENREILITVLINLLVELEANYIIRKQNIQKIIKFSDKIGKADEKRQEAFKKNYFNRIKQLVEQSSDFTKCLYLEYLLRNGCEYPEKNEVEDIWENVFCDVKFAQNVYLENTKVLEYGIIMLADCAQDKAADQLDRCELIQYLNDNYYFDSFIRYLLFSGVVDLQGEQTVAKFVNESECDKIYGMVQFQLFYGQLFDEKTNGNDFKLNTFATMMRYLKKASGAKSGRIIVPFNKQDNSTEYVVLKLESQSEGETKKSHGYDDRDDEETLDCIYRYLEEDKFEENTYLFTEDKPYAILKFTNLRSDELATIPMLYMVFDFEGLELKKRFEALKNILVFRNKIWDILNISSDTLLQNWTSEQFYKSQMVKPRAAFHSDDDNWSTKLKKLSEVYKKQKDEEVRALCVEYFNFLVNATIGQTNILILGGVYIAVEYEKYNLEKYLKENKNIFEMAAEMWQLKLTCDESDIGVCQIRSCDREKRKQAHRPSFWGLDVLLLAVLQNVYKHGKKDDEGNRVIVVKKDGNKLYFENEIDPCEVENIQNRIRSYSLRRGQGISMAVIYEIYKSWYLIDSHSSIFQVRKEAGKGIFSVILPILEVDR